MNDFLQDILTERVKQAENGCICIYIYKYVCVCVSTKTSIYPPVWFLVILLALKCLKYTDLIIDLIGQQISI